MPTGHDQPVEVRVIFPGVEKCLTSRIICDIGVCVSTRNVPLTSPGLLIHNQDVASMTGMKERVVNSMIVKGKPWMGLAIEFAVNQRTWIMVRNLTRSVAVARQLNSQERTEPSHRLYFYHRSLLWQHLDTGCTLLTPSRKVVRHLGESRLHPDFEG